MWIWRKPSSCTLIYRQVRVGGREIIKTQREKCKTTSWSVGFPPFLTFLLKFVNGRGGDVRAPPGEMGRSSSSPSVDPGNGWKSNPFTRHPHLPIFPQSTCFLFLIRAIDFSYSSGKSLSLGPPTLPSIPALVSFFLPAPHVSRCLWLPSCSIVPMRSSPHHAGPPPNDIVETAASLEYKKVMSFAPWVVTVCYTERVWRYPIYMLHF